MMVVTNRVSEKEGFEVKMLFTPHLSITNYTIYTGTVILSKRLARIVNISNLPVITFYLLITHVLEGWSNKCRSTALDI